MGRACTVRWCFVTSFCATHSHFGCSRVQQAAESMVEKASQTDISFGGIDDADEQLRKRIKWFTAHGIFNVEIDEDAVVKAAWGLDITDALATLMEAAENKLARSFTKKWAATSFLCSALSRRRDGGKEVADGAEGAALLAKLPACGSQLGGACADDADAKDKKLRKRIGWLNGHGGFSGRINYDNISEAAQGTEHVQVLHVLALLEEEGGRVKDPTAWTCAVLSEMKGGDIANLVASANWRSSERVAPTYYGKGDGLAMFNGGVHRALPAKWASFDAYMIHDDKKLRSKIGWLNHNMFGNVLKYYAISDDATGLNIGETMEILKDLERASTFGQVLDPNCFVLRQLEKKRGLRGVGVRRTIVK